MMILLGCLLGMLTGLIPGLGLFTALMIAYPWLVKLSATDLIIFYISMAAASQYTGSISALVLRIPGEVNSIFALKEAPILIKENKLDMAIFSSALGSMVGGIGALLLTVFLLNFLEPYISYFFRSDIKAFILLISVIVFVYFSSNTFGISLLFALFGFGLSTIGISVLGQERTFGFNFLLFGIPWYPLILGLWILPQLYKENMSSNLTLTKPKFYWNTGIVFRSTIIGYLGGLIPGISYIIGSKLSWLLENKISGNSLNRLLAAETANNSSAYSMIIPLLLLGVPIVSSEALILELANNKGFQFNWTTIVDSGWFLSTIFPIICLNVILAAVSIYCIKYLTAWIYIPKIKLVIITILLFSLYLTSNNIMLSFIVFSISLIVGFRLENKDVSPLILTLLIGDQLEHNITRLYYIYQ